jgi:hypothetical protein
MVHRLERQHLATRGERRFDFGKRRPGFRCDDELGRLIEADAGQRCRRQRRFDLCGAAQSGTRAAAFDAERALR